LKLQKHRRPLRHLWRYQPIRLRLSRKYADNNPNKYACTNGVWLNLDRGFQALSACNISAVSYADSNSMTPTATPVALTGLPPTGGSAGGSGSFLSLLFTLLSGLGSGAFGFG